ncbi:peptide MFS transporter [Facilibium subflavum]|uniref:peptide MFS transporter n=1 Tax=Facilibium subflavum TaxID=2219058 RepID=UPI000E65E885|nr:oligopeptide:H+ symporter [Facilibium subflavum]
MSQTLTAKHPKSLYYAIAVNIWEYFSYYGMRALLVLYLTQKLLFTDEHAYALYGAYTALVYVTPIIGGVIADRYLGYYWATLLGAATMVAGHLVLGLDSGGLYFGLALIICGYGLFKTNISCLLGATYSKTHSKRDSGFALMYVGGNIGAFIAPILCAWAAQTWGWHYGFLLAAIGMATGLVIFLCGKRHFAKGNKPDWQALRVKGFWSARVFPVVTISIVVGTLFFSVALYYLFAGWILLICVAVSLYFLFFLFLKLNTQDKKALFAICFFMIFGLIFWAFDQQGGSSISLFIERNVIRSFDGFTIPAASFQSINPFAILIGGVIMSQLWYWLIKAGVRLGALVKISLGLLVLTAGFFMIMLGAKIAASSNGQVSMIWVVVGMALIGFAELFVDPVALAEITRLNPGGSVGFLAGVYMLLTGSTANYLAAEIASLTSIKMAKSSSDFLISSAKNYAHVFGEITKVAAIACAILLVICFGLFVYRKFRHKNAVL